jgi:hypothetical protein
MVPLTPQKPVTFSWIVTVIPPVELEELEALDDELLELEELLLEDELELLDELLELEEELLLEDELLELELLEVPPSPAQLGAIKLPSCVPWKPKALLAVAPGAGSCQLQQLLKRKVVPGLVPVRVAFQLFVTLTCSGKVSVTVQLPSEVVPLLVTDTST